MVIKTEEIKAEMVTNTSTEYITTKKEKKRWQHMQAQPVIFWGG